jgi:hypothetical protein
MQDHGAGMNKSACEVRQRLRETLSSKARLLFEVRGRTAVSAAPNETFTPLYAGGELLHAIEAYRTALREFEWHVGEHDCE